MAQDDNQRVVTGGVGEWVIAVIVVGLASLIFVIAFGTTMVYTFFFNFSSIQTPPPLLKESFQAWKGHFGMVYSELRNQTEVYTVYIRSKHLYVCCFGNSSPVLSFLYNEMEREKVFPLASCL